jgi:hypothetical protein
MKEYAMSKLSIKRAISIIVFNAVTILCASVAQAQQHRIDGQVLDKRGNPMSSVLVRVYRGNKPLPGEFRTESDGRYSITFDAGQPIERVQYELSNWDLSLIESISGVRNHTINKVLVPKGVSRTEAEKEALASTLARVYLLDKVNGVSDAEFRARYSDIVEQASLSKEQFAWMQPPLPSRSPVSQPRLPYLASGKYEGNAKGAGIGEVPLTAEIKVDNGKVTGKLDIPQGTATIMSGTYADGKLTMKVDAAGTELTINGTFKDDKIIGNWALEGQTGIIELTKIGRDLVSISPQYRTPPASKPAAGGDPVTGEWAASADAGGTTLHFTMKLKLEGDKVIGSTESAQGSLPISKGSYVGDKLTFTLDTPNGPIVLMGIIKDGKLTGDLNFAGQMTGKWEAKKKN